MSSEPLSRHESRKRPISRPALVIVGVATVALLGGAGVASAAAASGPGGVLQGSAPVGGMQSPSPGMAWSGHGGWTMPVHGQIVLAKSGGGYQTVDFQNGSVTRVDSTSITLKSADGFTQSYPITGSTIVSAGRDGIGSVTSGNSAIVLATVSGHTATAVRIIDLTMLKAAHQMFGFGAGAHP
jgi:hypothetical protein